MFIEMILYNSLSRKKETFIPLTPDHVRMYICGPTVYDFAHLGNARAMVVFDVLYRLLKQNYSKVTYVRNVTDIDDKIYKASLAQNCHFSEIAKKFDQAFQEDMKSLNVVPPTYQPHATHFIPQIIEFIQSLIQKGAAYEAQGHVLFSIKKFPSYGQLSQKKEDELLAGARIEVASYKHDEGDFVLWKPSSGDMPGWDSPWGFGRPGWHIECSAMSQFYLGKTFDIHGGGIDLIFPHHENERAQSCCQTECPEMARFWMHNGHLLINGKKMSKSLGNFLVLRDVLKTAPAKAVRLALLMTHYRQPFNWTDKMLQMAKNIFNTWHRILQKFAHHPFLQNQNDLQDFLHNHNSQIQEIASAFIHPLHDDLNTPVAIQGLTQVLKQTEKESSDVLLAAALLGEAYLGCFSFETKPSSLTDEEIEQKVQERQKARENRDFQTADRLRKELLNLGIQIEDSKTSTSWYRLKKN